MNIKQIRSVRLQNTEGTSNKEYIVVIEERLDTGSTPEWRGLVVIAHWGKIGSELRSQAKSNLPCDPRNAKNTDEVTNRLLLSKIRKGYVVIAESGTSAEEYCDMLQAQISTTNSIFGKRPKKPPKLNAPVLEPTPEPELEEKHPLKRKDAFWGD